MTMEKKVQKLKANHSATTNKQETERKKLKKDSHIRGMNLNLNIYKNKDLSQPQFSV